MAQNLAIALIALFLLLAALFRSVKDSLYVILTIPLASFGGVLALVLLRLVTPQTLDLLTMVGFVVLMGLVVNNAILLVDQARSEMRDGAPVRAAVEVCAGHADAADHADYSHDSVRHVAAGARPGPRQRAVSRPGHRARGWHGGELGVHAGAAAHAAAAHEKPASQPAPLPVKQPTGQPIGSRMNPLASPAIAGAEHLATQSAWRADAPPVPVVVTTARAENVGASLSATGTVVSRNDARISGEVGGTLAWIAEPGTVVTRGDTIARHRCRERLALDAARQRSGGEAARGAAAAVGHAARIACRRWAERRVAEPARRGACHASAWPSRTWSRRAWRATAPASISNRATVRAPFAGIVAERMQQSGEFVASGAPLLRLVNDRALEVVARAPLDHRRCRHRRRGGAAHRRRAQRRRQGAGRHSRG